MSLERLLARKSLVLLGLNSGTSADGLDLAAVRISRRGRLPTVTFLTGSIRKYPAPLHDLIVEIADAQTVDLDRVVYLDNALGAFMGRTAAMYLKRLSRQGIRVDAIASHGQTVRHLPAPVRLAGRSVRGSLQLGAPEFIATETGKPVAADFRQADLAAGREGAPITTGAMHRLFGHRNESRLIVNIGGIANYFYLPAMASAHHPAAADCGPGNSLSDLLARRLYGERCDRHGKHAARGRVAESLLKRLLSHPFFSDDRVSTGKESFGGALLEQILAFGSDHSLSGEDMLATAIECTARTIVDSVQPIIKRDRSLSSLYLTGGGRKNSFLVGRLRRLLPDVTILPVDRLGISGDLVEAASFAVMGDACVRSEALNEHFVAGAAQVAKRTRRKVSAPVMGRIVQPPIRLRS